MLTQSWREGMGRSLSRYYPQASWVMESLWLEARWAGKLGIKATKTPRASCRMRCPYTP